MGRRTASFFIAMGCTASFFAVTPASAATRDYIVLLTEGQPPRSHAKGNSIRPRFIYETAVTGYAAALTDAQLTRLKKDPRVEHIERDEIVSRQARGPAAAFAPPAQYVPTGVRRVGADVSPTADIDGVDERIDLDVAVIDDGLDRDHPDLNVVGGKTCVGKDWDDGQHGTFVAGLIGALDNSDGVVGVAPGVRLWGVRVLSERGFGSTADIICGIEWVTRHADIIDVANMSIGGYNTHNPPCTKPNGAQRPIRAFHRAICRSVAAGVTYVAAAGNESLDARVSPPAAWPEVIATSAIGDSDGQPGGLGEPLSDCEPRQEDDHFAYFSNFGEVIDIAAPGVCVQSTLPGGRYGVWSGTSFASPIAAGGAALYLATHPGATPSDVRTGLISLRETGPIPDDPDGVDEGILDVSTL